MRTEKPWGEELLLEENDYYCVKKIFYRKGHRTSLQLHEQKRETLYCLSGVVEIETQDSEGNSQFCRLMPGMSLTLLPGTIHRMKGVNDCWVVEVSSPHLTDLIRLADDYGR